MAVLQSTELAGHPFSDTRLSRSPPGLEADDSLASLTRPWGLWVACPGTGGGPPEVSLSLLPLFGPLPPPCLPRKGRGAPTLVDDRDEFVSPYGVGGKQISYF